MSEIKEMLEGVTGKKIMKSSPRPEKEVDLSTGEEIKNEPHDESKS